MTGKMHPLRQIINELAQTFTEMGFEISESPEMDSVHYVFDALNVPKDHPARDMQDTFWVVGKEDMVMRTHTTSNDVRFMENNQPPFKVVTIGKVFRNEATDATHEAQFYQLDGLVVGKDISLAHLKYTLEEFVKRILGDDIEFKLRPGFFPFVEPGVELDLKFNGKWLELLGAGMVHPNVLRAGGLDPEEWSGFAFGMGVDRFAMMKYGITDVRMFYNGDLRLHHNLKSQ